MEAIRIDSLDFNLSCGCFISKSLPRLQVQVYVQDYSEIQQPRHSTTTPIEETGHRLYYTTNILTSTVDLRNR